MCLRREIAGGEMLPRGYGIAYLVPYRDAAVCTPLGLNVVVAWLHAAYLWLRFPPGRMAGARQLREAENRGYARGLERVGHVAQHEYDRGVAAGRLEGLRDLKAEVVRLRKGLLS